MRGTQREEWTAGFPVAALGAVALFVTTVAVAAPLAVYTLTLAALGLPHVLSEVRYVDRRFGRRIGRTLLSVIAALLLLIATTRAVAVFHLLPVKVALPVELGLVACLVLSVAGGSIVQRTVALTVGLGIGLATALAPFDTAVAFSILHNLTPLGFLWQISPTGMRARVMLPAVAGLLGLPVLVATGLPRFALAYLVPSGSGLDPLDAGPLAAQLYVYVPGALLSTAHAVDFFTASVVAQCGHYASVIVLLPFLLSRLEPGARGILPWPRTRWFFAALVVVSSIGLIEFARGFSEARALYGIFASVHAWLEIPVLILALTGGVQPKISSPARLDAALAASDTSMAR